MNASLLLIRFTVFTYVFFVSLLLSAQSLSVKDSTVVEVYKATADNQEQIVLLESYLADRPAGDTTNFLAEVIHKLALEKIYSSDPYSGLQEVNLAIKIRKSLDSLPYKDIARGEYLKAVLFAYTGNYLLATQWAIRALNTLELIEEMNQSEIDYKHNVLLGIAKYTVFEDHALAEHYLNAIPPLESSSWNDYIIESIFNVRGQILFFKGDYKKSEEVYQQGLEEVKNPFRRSTLVANLGAVYSGMKNHQKSAEFIQEGIKQQTEVYKAADINTFNRSLAAKNLVGYYANYLESTRKRGKTINIDSVLNLALTYAAGVFINLQGTQLSDLYNRAAGAHLTQGNLTRARALLDSAYYSILDDQQLIGELRLPKIKTNVTFESQILYQCLETHIKLCQVDNQGDTVKGLSDALTVYNSLDSLIREDHQSFSITSSLATTFRNQKVYHERAIQIALRAYRLSGESHFLNTAWQIVNRQKGILLNRYLNGPLLAGMLEIPTSVSEKKSALDLSILQTEKELFAADETGKIGWRDSLLSLTQQVQEFNQGVNAKYPKFAEAYFRPTTINIDKVIAALPTDKLVIEYFLGEDSIYAFTLSRESGLKSYVLPFPENLSDKINRVSGETDLAESLFDQLLSPLLSEAPSSISRLQIIPEGELWKIPFSALRQKDRFLLYDYAISYAYSSSMLFDERLKQDVSELETKFAGFGISYGDILQNIQTDGKRSVTDQELIELSTLPYASKEVKVISDLVKGDVWIDREATLSEFLAAIPGHQQLYLAMHGLNDPSNPLENALVFSSPDDSSQYSLLSTRDIMRQNFPARLAVLSACHTGAGPLEISEGVQSMARAFTFAGVNTTLASNWEASDQITHDILIQFYTELKEGKPLDRALQAATIKYLETASPSNQRPELWANLVLTGFTDPIYPTRSYWKYGILLLAIGLCGFFFRKYRRSQGLRSNS